MRKRSVQVLLGVALIIVAFLLAGVGAMLAFLVLFCVGAVVLLIARLYPPNRKMEDRADSEDRF